MLNRHTFPRARRKKEYKPVARYSMPSKLFVRQDMEHTRREFLEAAGSLAAAAASACSRPPASTTQLAGARGVELRVENGALPDYSHDLERYLVRLTNDARARRKQAIDAISTPQGVRERQKAVT